jgi:hypothetical protein
LIDPAPPEITTAAPLLHHAPGHDQLQPSIAERWILEIELLALALCHFIDVAIRFALDRGHSPRIGRKHTDFSDHCSGYYGFVQFLDLKLAFKR